MIPALAMRGISKGFPGVMALRNVDFELAPGEIHGLVGENGAGKSTLMKVLGGAYLPDSGTVEIRGKPASIRCPKDASRAGVSVIYQEFNLVPAMSVAENVFLGKAPRRGLGLPDRAAMESRTREVLAGLGFGDLDPAKPVRELSTARQQAVEIAKSLVNEASILVMDEPTAVLTRDESEVLFSVMEGLRASGRSIVFISHRLEEVARLCDRVTVLRDGEVVGRMGNAARDLDQDELVRLMVGHVLEDYFPARGRASASAPAALEARGISAPGLFEDVSLSVREGEILGVYGLVGSGRSEIAKGLAGIIPLSAGEVLVHGKPAPRKGRGGALRLALVPEDRKREGLVLGMSLADNVALPNLASISRAGRVSRRARRSLAEGAIESLGIRPADPERRISSFSGGNQQKAVIAKWLASRPGVLVFDEPTRGIDVGAKSDIYRIIARLAAEGAGVILISSELLEVLGMSDRIAVVRKGRVAAIFDRAEADQECLVRAAAGLDARGAPGRRQEPSKEELS